MKLSDFLLLSLEQKGKIALHEGVLIGKRTTNTHLIFLFQIDRFYIELFCNLESRLMEEVRMFNETKPLSPYIETIPIDDLLR
jgi:hypothetical protein